MTTKGKFPWRTAETDLSLVMTSASHSFPFAGKTRRGQIPPENDSLVQVVKMRPEILRQMLSTVLNIIMFEDCRNQWSMSRPLLGLILLNEEYFEQLRDQVRCKQSIYSSWLTKYSMFTISHRSFNLSRPASRPTW
jgi:hypothetical protein